MAAGGRIATGVMMRLRRWFLAPTTSMLAVLFFAPMAIIVAYSFLMRGAYGGVTGEWTIENYKRLFDPLYGAILARTLVLTALATLLCLTLGFPLAFFISRSSKRKNLVPSACDDPVLDELSRPHVCLDVPAPGYRPDQLRINRNWA